MSAFERRAVDCWGRRISDARGLCWGQQGRGGSDFSYTSFPFYLNLLTPYFLFSRFSVLHSFSALFSFSDLISYFPVFFFYIPFLTPYFLFSVFYFYFSSPTLFYFFFFFTSCFLFSCFFPFSHSFLFPISLSFPCHTRGHSNFNTGNINH